MRPRERRTGLVIGALVAASALAVLLVSWRAARRPGDRAPGAEGAPVAGQGGDGRAGPGPAGEAGQPGAASGIEPPPGEAARAGTILTGRVVRAEGEVPVSGALVRLSPGPPRAPDPFTMEPPPAASPVDAPADAPGASVPRLEERTGEDGRFRLDGIPLGVELLLEVDEPSSGLAGLLVTLEPDSAEAEGANDLGDIRLWPAMTLEVLVTDEDGAGIEHANVTVRPGRGVENSQRWNAELPAKSLEPRGAGLYALSRVPAVADSVTVAARGFVTRQESYGAPLEEPVRVALERAGVVEGRVLTLDGEPIPGAIVQCERLSPRPEGWATTDAEGRFRFEHLDLEFDYDLQVTAEGYCIAAQDFEGHVDSIEVRLFRESRVAGQVVALETGAALEGVHIALASADDDDLTEERPETTTDSRGRFELRKLPPGVYEVEVLDDEHLPGSLDLELEEGDVEVDLVFRLRAGVGLGGQVVEAVTGESIKNARISLDCASPDAAASLSREAYSEADGSFRIVSAPEGTCSLRASKDGYVTVETTVAVPAAAGPPRIELTRSGPTHGAITGRVLDPAGQPLARVEVVLVEAGAVDSQELRGVAERTDSDGRFLFERVEPAADRCLRADDGHHPPAVVTGIAVRPGEVTTDVVIRLARGATVRGHVRHADGRPAVDTSVSLDRPDQRSLGDSIDGSGAFEIRGVPAGEYTLEAAPWGGAPSRRQTITIATDETLEGLELVLPDGVRLTGRVVDADGKPCRWADVRFQSGSLFLSTSTERDGSFAFGPVPAGRAALEASDRRGGGATVMVDAPAEGVTLQLSRTFLVAGRLEAAGRKRLPRGQVVVELVEEGEVTRWEDYATDETGRFTVRTGPGKLLLAPAVSGFANVRYSRTILEAPREELVLPLVPAGRIEGIVVVRATGEPVAEAVVEVEPDDPRFGAALGTGSGPEGSFELGDLPAGTAAVRAWTEELGLAALARVRIEAGTTATVRLELEPSSGVQGQVRLEGEPVAGAAVVLRPRGGGAELSTRTRPSGGFTLEGAHAGDAELLVQAAGRGAPARRRVNVEAGKLASIDIDLRLALLTGRVLRPTGEPVGNATVYAVWAGPGAAHADADTNDQGEYELEVPIGAEIVLAVTDATGELGRLGVAMPTSGAELRREIVVAAARE